MPLTRSYEEHEVAPEVRRIFADVRASFDLPFVPSLFKLSAGVPEYLKVMWNDLGPVARSREFQASALALEEFARSLAVSDGWEFTDQARVLAEQKFSPDDTRQFAAIVAMFARAIPRLGLFARLMQRGYSGGHPGQVTSASQAAALAKLVTLHVPNQSEAGMRTWLLYRDIQKTTGGATVPSLFRVISPFPGYLASVWVEAKRVMRENGFQHSAERVSRRALSLLNGLPVRDHHAHARHVPPAQWKEIEETVDSFSRLLPQFVLLAAIWEHSFPCSSAAIVAA
jgi:hypothetical protein